jgi:hypothetical protein
MSAEYAKRGSFGTVRKDTTGLGLELLCEVRPVPDPNGLNRPSAPCIAATSALGTFRTWRDVCYESAMRTIPDIDLPPRT